MKHCESLTPNAVRSRCTAVSMQIMQLKCAKVRLSKLGKMKSYKRRICSKFATRCNLRWTPRSSYRTLLTARVLSLYRCEFHLYSCNTRCDNVWARQLVHFIAVKVRNSQEQISQSIFLFHALNLLGSADKPQDSLGYLLTELPHGRNACVKALIQLLIFKTDFSMSAPASSLSAVFRSPSAPIYLDFNATTPISPEVAGTPCPRRSLQNSLSAARRSDAAVSEHAVWQSLVVA